MKKIVITGAAGLVGQNLISQLVKDSNLQLTAIDKHKANLAILPRQNPQLRVLEHDLAQRGWRNLTAAPTWSVLTRSLVALPLKIMSAIM